MAAVYSACPSHVAVSRRSKTEPVGMRPVHQGAVAELHPVPHPLEVVGNVGQWTRIPPATATWRSPARIPWAASITRLHPRSADLLMVRAGTRGGDPSVDGRLPGGGLNPLPPAPTFPRITSSTAEASIPAAPLRPRTAMAPSWGAERGASPPRKGPMGVRVPERITGVRDLSDMTTSSKGMAGEDPWPWWGGVAGGSPSAAACGREPTIGRAPVEDREKRPVEVTTGDGSGGSSSGVWGMSEGSGLSRSSRPIRHPTGSCSKTRSQSPPPRAVCQRASASPPAQPAAPGRTTMIQGRGRWAGSVGQTSARKQGGLPLAPDSGSTGEWGCGPGLESPGPPG